MVETITPVVHGGRRSRWAADVALHVLGATIAAAAFGAVLGAVGLVLGAPFGAAGLALVAAVALGYGLAEVIGLRLPVPQARRQVPDWWRTFFSMPVFAFLYGAGLGVGFLTYLSRGTLLAVTTACLLSGRPLLAAAWMAPFGFARSSVVVLSIRSTTRERATALVDRLAEASRSVWWRAANAAALLALAAAAALAATRAPSGGAARLAAGLLAAVFAWAGVSKLLRPERWRRSLADHHLPPALERAALSAVPIAELGVAILAAAGYGTAAGALASALLVVFTGAVLRVRRISGGQVPCGCFGGRRSRDWRVLAGRNLALLALALAVAAGGSEPRISLPGTPVGDDVVPAMLAIGGVLVGGWVAVTTAIAFRAGTRAASTRMRRHTT